MATIKYTAEQTQVAEGMPPYLNTQLHHGTPIVKLDTVSGLTNTTTLVASTPIAKGALIDVTSLTARAGTAPTAAVAIYCGLAIYNKDGKLECYTTPTASTALFKLAFAQNKMDATAESTTNLLFSLEDNAYLALQNPSSFTTPEGADWNGYIPSSAYEFKEKYAVGLIYVASATALASSTVEVKYDQIIL